MSYSSQSERVPYWEMYSKLPTESFELMFRGLDIYNKMYKAWADFAELSSKGKAEDMMKAWSDSFTDIYKDMFEMFARPFRMLGFPTPAGFALSEKSPWEEAFKTWQGLLTTTPVGVVPPYQGLEEFVKFSRGWQESYAKMHNAWLQSLEKMAEASKAKEEKGEDAQKIWKAWMESTESFLESWSSFVSEQSKAFFQLWKSMMPKEVKKAPKKTKEEQAS